MSSHKFLQKLFSNWRQPHSDTFQTAMLIEDHSWKVQKTNTSSQRRMNPFFIFVTVKLSEQSSHKKRNSGFHKAFSTKVNSA